jgi:hypothetical protein
MILEDLLIQNLKLLKILLSKKFAPKVSFPLTPAIGIP